MKHLDLSGIENAYNDNTMLKFLYESYTIEVKKMQKTGREMKTYEVLCVCSYGGKWKWKMERTRRKNGNQYRKLVKDWWNTKWLSNPITLRWPQSSLEMQIQWKPNWKSKSKQSLQQQNKWDKGREQANTVFILVRQIPCLRPVLKQPTWHFSLSL